MLTHYEVVYLVHPDRSTQVPEMIDRNKKIVAEGQGEIHRIEDWGRRPLCYMIDRNHKAHFVLMNVECDVATIESIKTAFRYNDSVIRYQVIRVDDKVTTPSPMAHEANQNRPNLMSHREFRDIKEIDYKNVAYLSNFLMDTGRIVPARLSQMTAKQQRQLSREIKRARFLSLLPFCDRHRMQ